MKKRVAFFLAMLFSMLTWAQKWTPYQLATANTAKDVKGLTQVEKDAILYLNLARMYPKVFARFELEKHPSYWKGSEYCKSLLQKLLTMKPEKPIRYDQNLHEMAKCWAVESGTKGLTGHDRQDCVAGYSAECCSYGMPTGKDIVIQLLIDNGVKSLGHRVICLGSYTQIGISVHTHTEWGTCAVLDFR